MTRASPGKDELIREVRITGEEVRAAVQDMPADRFEEGRYEGGWNAREILAHLASIEWTYPRLIELARTQPMTPPAPRLPRDGNPLDGFNARQVQRRSGRPVSDLLDEFLRARTALIAALEQVDEHLLTIPVRSAGGTEGSLAAVMHFVAVTHVRDHVADITASRGTP